jgi:signal transduction histidine kinase
MFYQVEHGAKRAEGGLGIGLMLVRRLVEMHGGTVRARSEGPGKGSEFLVYLPAAEQTKCKTSRMGSLPFRCRKRRCAQLLLRGIQHE